MIISALFLITGVYMLTQLPSVNHMIYLKIVIVFLSIPIAIIGFKKGNKVLAALSLLMITATYGIAEMGGKPKKVADANTLDGKAIYSANCATCHGGDGKLNAMGAADLSKTQLDIAAIQTIILKGKGNMTKIEMSQEQAKSVASYVLSDVKGK
jgi:mono/diheme cytochrome c family protein